MSLEDKFINPAAPVEPPTQKSELPAKATRKRRKNEDVGAALRRSKRLDDDDDSSEVSAVLTLDADDGPRRPPKRMLFDPDGEAATEAAPPTPNERNGSMRAALSMATAPLETAPPQIVAPLAVPNPATTSPPQPSTVAVIGGLQSQAPKAVTAAWPPSGPKQHPIDDRDAAFRMAAQATREPEPAPASATDPGTDVAALASPIDTDPMPSATADAYDSVTPAVSDAAVEPFAAAGTNTGHGADDTGMAAEAPLTDPDDAAPLTSLSAPTPPMGLEAPSATIETTAESEMPEVQPRAAESKIPMESLARERAASGLSRSEAIARAARMSALSSSRTTGATASSSAMRNPPPAPPQRAELPKHPGDLFGYWTRVKNGRRFPSRADFDVDLVAENLPNSMLLTCGGNAGGQVGFSSILRLGAKRCPRPGEDLTFTSMITEWILAIGGEAVRAGTPVQDTEVFPSSEGSFAYKIVALPLSDQQSRVDHVLCHLSRS